MSKKGREASRRVREMQAAQRRAELRRRRFAVGGVALAAIAVIVVIVAVVQTSRDDTGAGDPVPAGVIDTYGVPRGRANAPVTVDLYEDFQCPVCKQFESWLGDTIAQEVDDGAVRVVYHPMAFLDNASTTDYSSRALEAAACVLDEDGPSGFVQFHQLLYEHQPAEDTAGLSDAELASLAEQAGADKATVESCQGDDTFDGWVNAATDAASKDHVTATPTMRIDGEDVPINQAQSQQDAITIFENAVAAASGTSGE